VSKTIGYARVSSTDQDLTIQETALKAAGASIVLSEKITGTTTDGREKLKLALSLLEAGDTLLITRLDRLGRSILDLANIVEQLKAKKVKLRATEQSGIEVGTPAGDAFAGMLSVFAQFETAIRRERQLEGIARAKSEGRYKGRPVTVDVDRVRELHADKHTPTEIAAELGISRASVYRALGSS
jgi:DNA invertase Pin-like site-specific DNA recombinase